MLLKKLFERNIIKLASRKKTLCLFRCVFFETELWLGLWARLLFFLSSAFFREKNQQLLLFFSTLSRQLFFSNTSSTSPGLFFFVVVAHWNEINFWCKEKSYSLQKVKKKEVTNKMEQRCWVFALVPRRANNIVSVWIVERYHKL